MPTAEKSPAFGAIVDPSRAAQGPAMILMARNYPVAFFTAIGIAAGLAGHLIDPSTGRSMFALTAILGGIPLIMATVRNMVGGRFYVDTIASVAILASILMGEYIAGALVVLMQSGGEALDDYGMRRANRNLDNLLRRAPSVARVRRDAEFVDIPAADVKIGDVLLIRPGDIIAADGQVISGSGQVDESALTGEPVPLAKRPDDQVFSGTINLAGSFEIRTINTAAQSKYELIVRMVQRAQGERAPINRLANRYTPVFTLITFSVAAVTLLLTNEPARALSVLVVATPCPLIIATPLAVMSAINRAASLNIIVKSGAAIEQAGGVESVVFDKTGTLTVGAPSLAEVRALDSLPADEILRAAAAVELHSGHGMASAIIEAAKERSLEFTAALHPREEPGSGVAGTVGGKRVLVGSESFLTSNGVAVPPAEASQKQALSSAGTTVAFVAIDQRMVGMLAVEDKIRPESSRLIKRLDGLGIAPIVMLTGDSAETARSVAGVVGIREVKARLYPEDKLAALELVAPGKNIMMVGDGINDAPALAAANVGVAMGGYGAGIATDAADIVITVENVERVADIIEIGRRMVRVATQGILFGIGASVLLMVLAAFGAFPPAVGALFQELIDLAAILNALRSR